MNNEHYLIHKDDYVKHINEKVLLYSFVKQLTHHIAKLKPTQANGSIILPFVDRFPKDTELYRIMTTKPQEQTPNG